MIFLMSQNTKQKILVKSLTANLCHNRLNKKCWYKQIIYSKKSKTIVVSDNLSRTPIELSGQQVVSSPKRSSAETLVYSRILSALFNSRNFPLLYLDSCMVYCGIAGHGGRAQVAGFLRHLLSLELLPLFPPQTR